MSALERKAASESSPGGVPRRVPRFVSCLIKGPLGCLFFLIGACVVLVLLLPPAGGRLTDKLLEEWFAEHHRGSLELADAWVGSFYGPQRIDSIILRDPEDDEVLRASLRAPALTEFGGDGYGPVEIRIASLRIVQARDGSTNLARALAERVRTESERDDGGLQTDQPFEIGLEVWIERLRYTDALGHEGTLDGCVLRGTLSWGPHETRLVLEGGPDAGAEEAPRAQLEFVRRASDPAAVWKQTLAFERLPSVLAGLLIHAAEPFVAFAGPSLDRLAWERDEDRVTLRVEDEGARFALEGVLRKGVVSSENGATLVLPCAAAASGEVLSRLLPILSAPECARAEGLHSLRLANAFWPLDGDWTELAGELTLEPATAQAPLTARIQALLAGAAPLHVVLDGPRRLGLVRAGVLEYAPLHQPLEEGWLELAGTLELASGVLDARLSGERAGAAFDLGHLVGTRQTLAPTSASAPASETPSPVPPDAPAPLEPVPERTE